MVENKHLLLRLRVLQELLETMKERRKIFAVELDNVEQLKLRISQLPNLDIPQVIMDTIESYGEHIAAAKESIAAIDAFLVKRAQVLAQDVDEWKQSRGQACE